MLKFSCSCQNYNGYLHVSTEKFYFSSAPFRLDLEWSNVKNIKLDTKQVKGIPTSVLVIGLTRTVVLREERSEAKASKRKKNVSKKYFFYGFQDVLSAEERVKTDWTHWRLHRPAPDAKAADKKASSSEAETGTGDNDSMVANADDEEGGTDASTMIRPGHSTTSGPLALTSRVGGGGASEPRPSTVGPAASSRKAPHQSVNRRGYVDVLTPQRSSRARKTIERVLVLIARVFSVVVHYFVQGGVISTLVLLFVVCIAVVTVHQMRFSFASLIVPSEQGTFGHTEVLLNEMQQVLEAQRSLGQYASLADYNAANKKRQSSAEDSSVWIGRLERAAGELAQKYTLIQAEMLNLRGRRAERFMADRLGLTAPTVEGWRRVFQEGDRRQRKYYLADPDESHGEPSRLTVSGDRAGSENHGGANSGDEGRGHHRHGGILSVSRIVDDVQFWRGMVSKTATFIRYLLPGGGNIGTIGTSSKHRKPRSLFSRFFAESDGGSEVLVRYTEPFLDGFDLVQYVTPDEKDERQQCQQMAKDLVQVATLIEDTLLGFSTLLMTDTYEKIAARVEMPHFWGSGPPATPFLKATERSRTPQKGMPVFSGDEVLRILFIRRYLKALMHLNPLEADEHRRRSEALDFSHQLRDFVGRDYELSRKMNRASKDELLVTFYNLVMPRLQATEASAMGMTTSLRNLAEEAKFWDRHGDLWMEHLLNSLPAAQRRKLMELATGRTERQRRQTSLWSRASASQASKSAGRGAGPDCVITENSTAEEFAHCRPRVLWKKLPIFKGLLCFTPQPTLQVAPVAGGAASGLARRPVTPRKPIHSPVRAPLDTVRLVNTTMVTTTTTPPTDDRVATSGHHGGADGGAPPESRADDDAGDDEHSDHDQSESAAGGAPSWRLLRAQRYAKSIATDEEFRHLFDPGRVENAVVVVKERWMTELRMFLASASPADAHRARPRRGRRSHERSMHMEENTGVAPALVASRSRLLHLVEELNRGYLPPIHRSSSGVVQFIARWLWPPSAIRNLLAGPKPNPQIEAIRTMATDDPAVQLAAAQVVEIPWGTTRDAPLLILKNVLLQPPELLKVRASLANRLLHDWVLLVVATVVLTLVYVFI